MGIPNGYRPRIDLGTLKVREEALDKLDGIFLSIERRNTTFDKVLPEIHELAEQAGTFLSTRAESSLNGFRQWLDFAREELNNIQLRYGEKTGSICPFCDSNK